MLDYFTKLQKMQKIRKVPWATGMEKTNKKSSYISVTAFFRVGAEGVEPPTLCL